MQLMKGFWIDVIGKALNEPTDRGLHSASTNAKPA
jgi:hypothetical protein